MKKRIFFDMALNIVATAVPVIVLQLILFPLVAKKIPSDEYGFLLTILSLMNMCPGTIASAINNIRLLHDNEYNEKSIKGDFNLLLYISILINIIIVVIVTLALKQNTPIGNVILIVLVSIIWILQNYYIVEFRININYKQILLNNVCMSIGYCFGYFLFLLTNMWIMIYLIGQLLGLMHILFVSKLKFWKEPNTRTVFFKNTTIDYTEYMGATFLGRCTSFADRLLLFPLMGGTTVSVYYAATVFGKIVSMAISPITGVVLSYIASEKKKPRKAFNQMLIVVSILGIFGYIIAILISRPVLTVLYPQFVDDAMQYIYLTTAALVVSVISSIINPFILKFYSMSLQVYINMISVAVYIGISLILLHFSGLYGFCIGVLLANIAKTIFMLVVYYGRAGEKQSI